ncbi:hypothetical protein [Pseudonocardia spinosispora]|uniref:hypothetical protein n=1 Tax=Pseudonocardia spinosispora TaxID=103441 RepID=UPI000421A403|nr:hypothetical protein [Pseudonocardia spinosispora]
MPTAAVSTRKGLRLLASAVKLVGSILALILVVYIIFVVGEANPANPWTGTISDWAHSLNFGLDNLFTPAEPKLAVTVNYGIAALIWIVLASIVAKILRRL